MLGEPAIKMLRYQQQYTFFDEAKMDGAGQLVLADRGDQQRLVHLPQLQRWPLRGGVGEHDLVRQCGLAAAGSAGDDVE